jgi:hypothetical protein
MNDTISGQEVVMENERAKVISEDEDGLTRGVLDFGSPDDTLDEAVVENPTGGSTSMRSEQLRLNRNFLEDAAPFELDGFGSVLEARTSRLQLSDDPEWTLPLGALVLIRGAQGSGKSCLLMNMLWRFSERYPKHHFLYYSFERQKAEILLRFCLLGAQQILPDKKGLDEHLAEWRRLLISEDPETLKRRCVVESPLAGLASMLTQGHRLHVVDRLMEVRDLTSSLETFAKNLPLTVVFIDGGDWLLHGGEAGGTTLPTLLAQLRRTARNLGLTLVMSLGDAVPPTPGSPTLYDAVGNLGVPWGGGGALHLEWLEPGRNQKLDIPLTAYNQRFVWKQVREAEEIE